jgi:hypothetical protein
MLPKQTNIIAIAALFLFGSPTLALAQISGPSSSSTAGSVPGAPAPAPTPGQSITIPPNTPGITPQGIGPTPAPTPGQSVTIPGPARTIGSVLPSESVRPVPTPRQSRIRGPRKPKAVMVGSGSPQVESPSRPQCFETPSLLNESGVAGNQNPPINTPQLHSQTGRPLAGATKC